MNDKITKSYCKWVGHLQGNKLGGRDICKKTNYSCKWVGYLNLPGHTAK